MLERQLVLTHAHRRHAGIDHQVVANVVEHRDACQRRPALLRPEGALQRCPRRQAKGRAVHRPQPKPLPPRRRPAGAEGLDRLAIEGHEQLLREVLAGFAEGRPGRRGQGQGHTQQGCEEALQFQLGTALTQIEHERDQALEGKLALPGERLRMQAETRDHLGACQSLSYTRINRFK